MSERTYQNKGRQQLSGNSRTPKCQRSHRLSFLFHSAGTRKRERSEAPIPRAGGNNSRWRDACDRSSLPKKQRKPYLFCRIQYGLHELELVCGQNEACSGARNHGQANPALLDLWRTRVDGFLCSCKAVPIESRRLDFQSAGPASMSLWYYLVSN
jgi:hypothetical protein